MRNRLSPASTSVSRLNVLVATSGVGPRLPRTIFYPCWPKLARHPILRSAKDALGRPGERLHLSLGFCRNPEVKRHAHPRPVIDWLGLGQGLSLNL